MSESPHPPAPVGLDPGRPGKLEGGEVVWPP